MRGDESGQVTVLILGLALVVIAVSGLAVDGTRAFLYRRTLQSAADSSALAAAGELERDTYYSTGGRVVVLDRGAAAKVAAKWLTARGVDARAGVEVEDGTVVVTLRGESRTTFLRMVGIVRLPVAVAARAEPLEGAAPAE